MNKFRRSLLSRAALVVRRDFWRKLIALFFAVLLYLYGYEVIKSEPQKISDVPVDVILPPELMDVDPKAYFVTLDVRGNRDAGLTSSMLRGRATVSFGKFVPGKPYILELKPEMFNAPLGVRVMRVTPAVIALNLQQRQSRDVPVRVVFSNKLSSNYKQSAAASIPSVVRVTGPEQLVNELKYVSTKPIPLSESVTESFEYLAVLEPPTGIAISPAKVTVQIEIEKNYELRAFPSLPLLLLTRPDGRPFKAELVGPSRVEVTVGGLSGAVAGLTAAEIRPYLDISHIDKPGIYEIAAGCYVKGDGLDVKAIRPEMVKVKITE